MAENLLQIVYRSRLNIGRVDSTLNMLRDIIRVSAGNNIASNITGFLLFDGETFLQILEGPEVAVRHTLARISSDARHRAVETLVSYNIAQRSFPSWRMGGYIRDDKDLEIFRSHGATTSMLEDVPPDAAMKLALELSQRGRTVSV